MKTPQDIRLDQIRQELKETKETLHKRELALADALELVITLAGNKMPSGAFAEFKESIKKYRGES